MDPNYGIILRPFDDHYDVECKTPSQEFTIQLKRSKLMDEWNIASCPNLYRSSLSTTIVLQNQHLFNFDSMKYHTMSRPWAKVPITDDLFHQVLNKLVIPGCYEPEITEVLGIDCIKDLTLERLQNDFDKIPQSIDVSKWRILKTIDHLVLSHIWRDLSAVEREGEIGGMSVKSLSYNTRVFYTQNLEFIASDMKKVMVPRKVVLPIHNPTRLLNNPLVMTSTPQSEDAGAIAELPIGIEISDLGYIKKVPNHSVGITNAQCPFPGKMLPNREVVLKAISQARKLEHQEMPWVISDYVGQPIPEGNVPIVSSRNFFAARMEYFGLTHNDGYVISRSAAEMMGSWHESIDKLELPPDSEILVEPVVANPNFLMKEYWNLVRSEAKFINKGPVAMYLSNDPESPKKVVLSKHKGIVRDVQIRSYKNKLNVIIKTLTYHPIAVGSKLTDRHSQKGTVSIVLDDCLMPMAQVPGTGMQKRLEIIGPTWIGKRATPSREMEEIISIKAFINNKPVRSDDMITLGDVREMGTNESPIVSNLGDHKFAMMQPKPSAMFPEMYGTEEESQRQLAQDKAKVPVGFVAFSVLDHIPSVKAKYSHKIKTDYKKRTRRGRGNYNFTDGLFAMIQCKANNLIDEIQSYSMRDNDNIMIMQKNLEALGLTLNDGRVGIMTDGVFKDTWADKDVTLIKNGYRKNISEEDQKKDNPITDTVYDPELNLNRVAIRLPKDIPLFVEELVQAIGSQTIDQTHAYRFLTGKKAQDKMKKFGIPFNHIYNRAEKDKYLIIPAGFIYTYMHTNGDQFHSALMGDINELVTILNNTEKTLQFQLAFNDLGPQVRRCNILFNRVLNKIIKATITKSGIIREVLSPRTPYSGYFVASNASHYPINEIHMPARTIAKYMNNDEFREAYGFKLETDYSMTDIINHFEEHYHRCLVMRQPCHRRDEISSYRLKCWHEMALGIHSVAIEIKSGDHDGDCVFTYLPVSPSGKADLEKMKVEDMLHKAPNTKGLTGMQYFEDPQDTIQFIAKLMIENTGMVENIYASDHCERYHQYGYNVTVDKHREGQALAAKEFHYIKTGTASAGGIGNCVRHIMMDRHGIEGIRIGNDIYKGLAQAALDTKGSTGDMEKLESLLEELRSLDTPERGGFQERLLYFLDDECYNAMIDILYSNGRWNGGVNVIAAKTVPFSRILYRGNLSYMYRATRTPYENSAATFLAQLDMRDTNDN